MADKMVPIDADLTLEQTAQRCEGEQQEGFQLDIIKFGTIIHDGQTFPVNKAEFHFESSIKILENLTFVPVGGGNPQNIIEQMKSQGETLICDTHIFVQNHITRVLVFGKNV